MFCGLIIFCTNFHDRICGVMGSVLASHAGDPGLNPGWVKPKTLKLVFTASLAKHAALRSKIKD